MSSLHSHVTHHAVLGSTRDPLHALISLGLANWDGHNLASNSAVDVVLEVSTLAHQAQMLVSSLDLLTTFHPKCLGHLESCCFEMDWEMGEMQVQMMELEMAWEQQEIQASSGYISLMDEVGEEEGELEMDEEGLWSPTSSNHTVLTLVPDGSAFPTQ
ncbi:hypothetical protein BDM02DRAFT_3194345 [Thelephora ganbajun]|uniref:Uncharacterized protein n=1 Tax=Thelephora ganbajun TaxID=370292 RepID=A0ACB6YWQ7_THEGA|nr:hypothetical protein BDM02DRAFT_3194345 [Thelephora ganbajun]